MKIIVDRRQAGKTTKLIMLSSETGYPIITPSEMMADAVVKLSKLMRVKIPQPLSINAILRGGAHGPGMHGRHRVLMDELPACLDALGLEVVYATITIGDDLEPRDGLGVDLLDIVRHLSEHGKDESKISED